MNSSDRTEKINSFGQAFDNLNIVLNTMPRELWKYKPSSKEWSIHEIIIHLADIEANVTVRLLKALAEPGGTIMPLDPDAWADGLYYFQQDSETALQVYRWLRAKNFHLIKLLSIDRWSNYMTHPESGEVTLDSWLDNYERHGYIHIEQIKRVYLKWQEQYVFTKSE